MVAVVVVIAVPIWIPCLSSQGLAQQLALMEMLTRLRRLGSCSSFLP